jgi:hypothetical protein
MTAFGSAPADPDIARSQTPVGEPCLRCEEPIAPGDSGYTMPYVAEGGVAERALHRECFLRGVVGSVGHQQRRCSCYGGTLEDPPGLTRREAAAAAVRLYASKLRDEETP